MGLRLHHPNNPGYAGTAEDNRGEEKELFLRGQSFISEFVHFLLNHKSSTKPIQFHYLDTADNNQKDKNELFERSVFGFRISFTSF